MISDGCCASSRHSPNSSKEGTLPVSHLKSFTSGAETILHCPVKISTGTIHWQITDYLPELPFFPYSVPSVHMDDPFAVFPCHSESELNVLTVLQSRSSPGLQQRSVLIEQAKPH